jgi:hypothetical protein
VCVKKRSKVQTPVPHEFHQAVHVFLAVGAEYDFVIAETCGEWLQPNGKFAGILAQASQRTPVRRTKGIHKCFLRAKSRWPHQHRFRLSDV